MMGVLIRLYTVKRVDVSRAIGLVKGLMMVQGIMSYRGEALDIEKMGIEELRKVINILMELMSHEHDRVTQLIDRVLELEMRVK